MVNPTNSKREPKSKTINLVRNWLPVPESTRFSRMDKGYASSNWIFSYNNSRYILKRFMDWKKRSDIEKEYELTNYVRKSGFPYEVPEMLPAKNGKPYIENEGALYSMYRFILGNADLPITKKDAYEIGSMDAQLHDIFEKKRFESSRREGYQALENIKARLHDTYEKALHKTGKEDKAFMSAYKFFAPLLNGMDLSYYETLKSYPVHFDIAADNLLWRNGRIYALIDFANIANYRDALLMDLAWAIHFCAVNKKTRASYNKILLKALIDGYTDKRSLSKEDAQALPSLLAITNASDTEFFYNSSRKTLDQKAIKIKSQIKLTKWALRNKGYFLKMSLSHG